MACGLHPVQFAREGFEFLLKSCPMLAPQNGGHHTLIIHFTEVNSPFSTASAGSPSAPSSSIPHPGTPNGMCSVQCCLPDQAFSGVSISPWQLLAPCASPLDGWLTARTPLLHTPSTVPKGHCPPSSLHFAWPWLKNSGLVGYQTPV